MNGVKIEEFGDNIFSENWLQRDFMCSVLCREMRFMGADQIFKLMVENSLNRRLIRNFGVILRQQ